MFKILDNNKRNAENTRRLVGVPNAPMPSSSCSNLHHLQPDHVIVASSLTRLNSTSSSSSTPFSNGSPFRSDHCPTNTEYSESSSFQVGKGFCDDLGVGLSNDFSRMNIIDGTKTWGCSLDANVPCFNETGSPYCNGGVSPGLVGKGFTFGTPVESSPAYDHTTWRSTNQMYHLMDQRRKQGTTGFDGQVQFQKPSFANPYLCDRFVGSQSQHFGLDCEAGWNGINPIRFSQIMHPRIALNPNANSPSHYCPATRERAMAMAAANNELPLCLSPRRSAGDSAAFRCDNGIIIQGKDAKHCIENGYGSLRGSKRSPRDEVAIQAVGENVSRHVSHTLGSSQICENNSTLASDATLPSLLKFYSLTEVEGSIYNIAKDQNGCRFLQRIVDEGTNEDMRMVFEVIIDNVVELMMDPFGNYLVQKLLDVCSEDQRLQIVLMLTKEPGQLVQISLNTHGTRVVQKLIETLNSAKQISLVKSAIQPGFLDLIKDLNGNHVIQRCLQCLSCQDNEFIFDAGVKFCVDIATHRHGCCVLQRCIDHSAGRHRDKLVAEICKHGLLLAQDPFGNYVVQYIIEMEIPTASSKLLAQFKGHYVNLSMQKFSSHVVEKCLKHVGESRSRIVQEFLSAPHFEQVLQDPYANYVIQSALALTKGPLHASLVEAVRPYKMLRSSPFCKRIFSGSLLKK